MSMVLQHRFCLFLPFIFVGYVLSKVEREKPRIIGGRRCDKEVVEVMVMITEQDGFECCGGSLLNSFWVLTACHCTEAVCSIAVVGLSTQNIDYADSKLTKKIPIARSYCHARYNIYSKFDDIALLRLSDGAPRLSTVKYIKLPKQPYDGYIQNLCSKGLVMGWGMTSAKDSNSVPKYLQCVDLDVISTKECRRIYNLGTGEETDKIMCTLTEDKDSCQGDSGGPLICNGIQYGIISWGIGCAEKGNPGVYVRVDLYLDFIYSTMEMGDRRALSRCASLRASWIINVILLMYIFISKLYYNF